MLSVSFCNVTTAVGRNSTGERSCNSFAGLHLSNSGGCTLKSRTILSFNNFVIKLVNKIELFVAQCSSPKVLL